MRALAQLTEQALHQRLAVVLLKHQIRPIKVVVRHRQEQHNQEALLKVTRQAAAIGVTLPVRHHLVLRTEVALALVLDQAQRPDQAPTLVVLAGLVVLVLVLEVVQAHRADLHRQEEDKLIIHIKRVLQIIDASFATDNYQNKKYILL